MQDLLAAIDHLYEIAAIAAVLLVCGVALVFGDKPIRLAGTVQLADVFVIATVSTLFDPRDELGLMHGKSLIVLLAYVVLMFLWRDRYLVVLTGLQGFAVLVHFSDLIDPSVQWPINRLLLNLTGWSMLGVLAIAAGAHLLDRLDARGPKASREPGKD